MKIIQDQPEQEYRTHPALNNSTAKIFVDKTPAHARYSEPKSAQHFDDGKAIHCTTFEPHEFESRFFKGPADRRGNKWKEAQQMAGDMTVLTESSYENALRVRDALQKNTEINNLVSANNKMVEVSCYWEHDGIDMKSRKDLVVDDGRIITDLKTTTDASRDGFSRAVANYLYHMQDRWYSMGARACFGAEPTFLFIAVEKEPPFANAIYELDPRTKAEGQALVDLAIERYIECERNQEWPGYPAGVQQLSIPGWAFKLT
jgi:hypothetical protein